MRFSGFSFIIKEYHRKTRNTETMRVTFYTLGCKVNQNETGALAQLFEENGYTVVSNE